MDRHILRLESVVENLVQFVALTHHYVQNSKFYCQKDCSIFLMYVISLTSSIIGSNFASFALFLQSYPKLALFINLKKSFLIAFFTFCLDFLFIDTKSLLKRTCSNVLWE